jgi:hypothetical protein
LLGLGRVGQRVRNERLATFLDRLEFLLAVQTQLLIRKVIALATFFLEYLGVEVGLVIHLPLTVTLFSRHGLATLLE